MKCAQTLEVGAYVLGALSPAERDAFERHLGDCAICRDEVADLAVLPGLLGRIDAATAMAVARDGEEHSIMPSTLIGELSDDAVQAWAGPTTAAGWAGPTAESNDDPEASADRPGGPRWAGPTLDSRAGGVAGAGVGAGGGVEAGGGNVVSLLDAAARRRTAEKRRRRFGTISAALVAACLALAVGLGLPPLLRGSNPAGPALTAMSKAAAAVPVTAELALQPVEGGTRVIMHCAYGGTGTHRWQLRLVAVPRSGGSPVVLSDWSAGHGDEFEFRAMTTLKPGDIDRIEIWNADGVTLLSLRF